MYHHLIEALTDLPLPQRSESLGILAASTHCAWKLGGAPCWALVKAANKTDLVSALLKFSPLDATAEPLFF